MSHIQTISALVGRVLIAVIFLIAGINKIPAYAVTQNYMDSMGVPGVLLPLVILLEIIGGIAIILGWQSRFVAFALAIFSILSAILFHSNFANQNDMIMFMKNIAIAGGFLFVVAHGPGAYALDNLSTTKRDNKRANDE